MSESSNDPIAELYAQFLDLRRRGEITDLASFLEKCPEEFREELARSISFAERIGIGEEKQSGFKPQSRFGDFEVGREIGRGGMGVVYEATQLSLKRTVALKLIAPWMIRNDRALGRLHREAQSIARLRHPNIVTVFATGEEDGVRYIAMELLSGKGLDEVLREAKDHGEKIPVPTLLRWFTEIAEALHSAHLQGLIHRDVKPSNIRITEDGKAILLDFGLAHDTQASLSFTRTGEFQGTPFYCSPEQVASKRTGIDERTDVYSLGVALYQAITGKLPFEGDTTEQVFNQILVKNPVAPRRINPEISDDLETVVLTAMEKDRDHRYPTMLALGEDLRALLEVRPIKARPTGSWTRLKRWSERNPLLASSFAAIFVLLVGGLMVSIYLLQETSSSYKFAKRESDEKNVALKQVTDERNEKQKALEKSEGLRFLAEAKAVLPKNPTLAILLGIEGAKRCPGLLANNVLLEAMSENHEERLFEHKEVEFLRFTPDGRRLISFSWKERTTKVWDVTSNQNLITLNDIPFMGDHSRILSADGSTMIVADFQGRKNTDACSVVKLVDLVSGKVKCTLTGHDDMIRCATFSLDDKTILTTSEDLTLRIWDAQNGQQLSVIHHPCDVYRVEFIDTQRIVAVDAQAALVVWSLTNNEKILEKILGSKEDHILLNVDHDQITTIVLPEGKARTWDGKTLAPSAELKIEIGSSSSHGKIRPGKNIGVFSEWYENLWSVDLLSGKPIRKISGLNLLDPVNSRFGLPEISLDGKQLIFVCGDNSVKVVDAMNGQIVEELFGHESKILSLALHPDGKRVATGSLDGTVRLWRLEKGQPFVSLKGHSDAVVSASFSPDGEKIISISNDHTGIVWDWRAGRPLHFLCAHSDKLSFASFSPDGKKIITGGIKGNPIIWDVDNGKPLFELDNDSFVGSSRFSKDGKWIISASVVSLKRSANYDSALCLWDATSGAKVREFPDEDDLCINSDISSDSKRLISTHSSGSAKVWNIDTGELLKSYSPKNSIWWRRPNNFLHTGYLNAIDAIGNNAVTWDEHGLFYSWDLNSNSDIARFEFTPFAINLEDFRASAISGDGKRILIIRKSYAPILFENKNKPNSISLAKHVGEVNWGDFSKDGNRVVTVGQDKTVRLWNSNTGEEMSTYKGHEGPVLFAKFSSDGNWIVTGSEDNTAIVWPVDILQWAVGHRARDFTFSELRRYGISDLSNSLSQKEEVEGKESQQDSIINSSRIVHNVYHFSGDHKGDLFWGVLGLNSEQVINFFGEFHVQEGQSAGFSWTGDEKPNLLNSNDDLMVAQETIYYKNDEWKVLEITFALRNKNLTWLQALTSSSADNEIIYSLDLKESANKK